MEKKDLIRLIATGLVEWYEEGQVSGSLSKMPYQLKRGMNRLCAQMPLPLVINNRIEMIKILSRPIRELGLNEKCPAYDDEILIVDGMPSDLCYDLAVDERDAQGSIEQGKILEIINLLRIHGQQEDYVNIRRFIIENPITTEEQIDEFIRRNTEFNAELRKIYSMIKVFYEDIPYHVKHGDEIKICKHCGWTIQEKNGITTCISNHCKAEDAHRDCVIKKVTPSTKRLKQGAMRYLCFPGQPELALMKKLQKKKGIQVELWPYFDKYDIEVTFANEKWALDIKDYANPYHLIEKVTYFEPSVCSRSFMVIPKRRTKFHKGYKKILRAEKPIGFEFIGEDELINIINKKVKQ